MRDIKDKKYYIFVILFLYILLIVYLASKYNVESYNIAANDYMYH